MVERSLRSRWLHGALACVGLGMVAGGLEMIGHAASLRLPLGFGGFVVLGVAALVGMGALGALAGLVAGMVHLVVRDEWASRPLSLQAGLAASLLAGWYLWEGAAALHGEGRPLAAALMAAMPLLLGAVTYFNAAYWWRRADLGAAPRVGWLAVASAVGGGLVLLTAAGHAARDTGGGAALTGDASVVLVTVDGLSRGAVFGEGGWDLPPDALRYLDAVTPLPASRPANATALTGLHPLRHRVIDDATPLARGRATLATVFESEGYATGAFVSHAALDARSGLDRGFRTYDDALRGGPAGLWRLSVLRRLGGQGAARRDASATTTRALAWLSAHRGVPFFLWVHYDATDGSGAAVSSEIARIEAALVEWGLDALTGRVVVGTYGDGRELEDPVVRIPLVVRAPGLAAVERAIEPQVRLMDVAPTVMALAELDGLAPVEGVELLGYALRTRRAPMWCALVGPDGSAWPVVGMRNNGVKYVLDLRTGVERLYDLASDPGERADLAASQPDTLAQARGLVSSEAAALRALLGGP